MILRLGDHSDKVKLLQQALNRYGYNLNDDEGSFGEQTEAAVRQCQKDNGLDMTGIAGPNTLLALGLDPETLEDLSNGNHEITFHPDEVNVPAVVRDKIRVFVDLAAKQHNAMLNALLNALPEFESTTSFTSGQDADPDALGVLVSKAYEMGVNEVMSLVPGLSSAKVFFDATTEELERAGRTSPSLHAGNWIKDQRTAINERLNADAIQQNRDRLQADTESDFLDQDESGRQKFFAYLNQAVVNLSDITGAPIIRGHRTKATIPTGQPGFVFVPATATVPGHWEGVRSKRTTTRKASAQTQKG